MFILRKLHILFVNLVFCLITCPLVCIDPVTPENTVIVVDLDDVVSIKGKMGPADYLYFWSLLPWGSTLPLIMDRKAIAAKGEEIQRTTEGTSNIVNALLTWLKEEKGYTNLALSLGDAIVERVMKPEPIPGVIQTLQDLKAKGYTIVAATNQDYPTQKAWREGMQKYTINTDALFDAVLTTRGADPLPPAVVVKPSEFSIGYTVPFSGPVYRHEHNVFEATDARAQKPEAEYYELLKNQVIPAVTTKNVKHIIFTDDKCENVAGALKFGIHGIRFPLPMGVDGHCKSARKATLQELNETVNAWKRELQCQGLPVS